MNRIQSGWLAGAALIFAGGTEVEAQSVSFSGNVALTSDYAFRGISQTLAEPAIQGGIDASGPFGLYAGAWSSSVNFGEDLDGGARAQMELDVYGGVARSIAGFDADVGVLYYTYPGSGANRNYDFFEAYAGLSREVGQIGLGVSAAYSPDFFAGSGSGLWTAVDAAFSVPRTPVGLSFSVGRQMIEDNEAWGTPDYTAWSFDVVADVLGVSMGAGLDGTDLDARECLGGTKLCETRAILSIGVGM